MNRYKKIDALVQRIIAEKERIDCEHVRKTAQYGCHCRRCRTARHAGKVLTKKP